MGVRRQSNARATKELRNAGFRLDILFYPSLFASLLHQRGTPFLPFHRVAPEPQQAKATVRRSRATWQVRLLGGRGSVLLDSPELFPASESKAEHDEGNESRESGHGKAAADPPITPDIEMGPWYELSSCESIAMKISGTQNAIIAAPAPITPPRILKTTFLTDTGALRTFPSKKEHPPQRLKSAPRTRRVLPRRPLHRPYSTTVVLNLGERFQAADVAPRLWENDLLDSGTRLQHKAQVFSLVKEDFARPRVSRASVRPLPRRAWRQVRYEPPHQKGTPSPPFHRAAPIPGRVQSWKRVEIFLGLDWLTGI